MKKMRYFLNIVLILFIFVSTISNCFVQKSIYYNYFSRLAGGEKFSIFDVLKMQEKKYVVFNNKREKYLKNVKEIGFVCFKGRFLSVEDCSNEFALMRYQLAPIAVKYKTNAQVSEFFTNGMYPKSLTTKQDTEYIAGYFKDGVYPPELLSAHIYPYIALNNNEFILKVREK